jgi:hypothetical protein
MPANRCDSGVRSKQNWISIDAGDFARSVYFSWSLVRNLRVYTKHSKRAFSNGAPLAQSGVEFHESVTATQNKVFPANLGPQTVLHDQSIHETKARFARLSAGVFLPSSLRTIPAAMCLENAMQ